VSSIFKFDSKKLDKLLLQYGIKKTWLYLLATHLNGKKDFQYILKCKEFNNSKILSLDLLKGLSIGEVSILYEYSVAKSNSKSRKSNGQFFTPDDVADFMASYSSEFGSGTWLDPCSGIGNLSWHLVAAQSDPEEFLLKNMILSDKDELALLVARCLLTISFQNKHKRLFDEIEHNFVVFDFLSVADNGDYDLFSSSNTLDKIPKHDFVIVNPPYLATKKDSRFETSKAGDLYAYFLENVIKTSKGFVSITPQSFTNAQKFNSLRRILLKSFQDLRIFTFDNVPANIFKGIKFGSTNSNQANSIRAAVIIAKPGGGKPQITSLLRWKTSERRYLFKNIERFLSDVKLTEEFFPKVSKNYKKLYIEMSRLETLGSTASLKRTRYPLYIPSAPRYFIPALKKPAKRSSQKVIYFPNEEKRDYAYMLMNSSLLYWWWRVRDGGMTLSLATLLSLPLPNFKINHKIVVELEKSEKVSKVYKQNAGAPQENVKHPRSLINKLNQAVIPEHAKLLSTLHENSEFTRLIGQESN
jgi:hypothetical protein